MLAFAIKSQSTISKHAFQIMIGAYLLGVVSLFFINSAQFSIDKLLPEIGGAAVMAGLLRVRDVYRTTRVVRSALKVAFGWSVITVIILFIGEETIGWLLENNIDRLAGW
ncbi:hypothetical protein BC351_38410 [Paenibacillus ferrarius]|uniref:Uncharacterized protein n=1 Tax=Paenibacillus ferrarius TaxID=1469647 RepID=A0A1V4H9Z2_9BACL|nr:hypothetical protein [Paenibacillus ferrarius]OPH48272.1 hypothetical protein BC351_38410 [Paenibacillus ferrarius]